MCILCVSAGKAAGGVGCIDASASDSNASGAATFASQPNDGGIDHEAPGSDTVAGSTSTSSSISNATAIHGYVNSSGDQDWYRVDLVAGQKYTFALNGFGKGALQDPFLHLYNSSGVEIGSDDDNGPLAGSKLTITASATGSYYVGAAGYGSGTGQYMLTMNTGAAAYTPVVTVQDAADYLTNTYWEVNGQTARHWGTSSVTVNLDGLEPERAVLARAALQLWSSVCNLSFVETHGAASITIDDTQAGQAYSSSTVTAGGLITASTVNVASDWYGGIDAVDSYTMQTFIHEIGHAIGLGHAGAYNGSATYGVDNIYANDTWQMSVMSYMAQNNDGSDSYRFVMTPMMADIMAVQSMYGAASFQTGDTVYGFGSTAGSIYNFAAYSSAPELTIYDAGGTDTLNASGFSQNQVIDLRPGSFSNIGGLVGNIGIYLTTVIEKAVGGSGNDTIYGNDANNTLKGGAGNDTIDGGVGTDTAVFAGMRSAYTITALDGITVRVAGPDGTDTLTNVELLAFDDQTLNWQAPPASTPTPTPTPTLTPIPDPTSTPASGGSAQPDHGAHALHVAALVDFTHDGRADALWRDDSGAVVLWTMDGAQQVADQVVSNLGSDWKVFGTADFNGDGKADILLRNDFGSVAIWTMDGAQKVADQVVSNLGNDWKLSGTADFNGDGKSDILLRNDFGAVAIWTMNGGVKVADQVVSNLGNDWKVSGTADFNGDGKTDILLRNDFGAVAVWTMDGAQKVSDVVVSNLGNDWKLFGTADFNGDGKSDILLRNDFGAVAIWTMNGAQKVSDVVVSDLGNDWKILTTADFNGDGKSDILLRNDFGALAIWSMNGAQKVADDVVSELGNDWHYLGVGDFNGDHKSDILIRHDTGTVALWTMDGAHKVADQIVSQMGHDWNFV